MWISFFFFCIPPYLEFLSFWEVFFGNVFFGKDSPFLYHHHHHHHLIFPPLFVGLQNKKSFLFEKRERKC